MPGFKLSIAASLCGHPHKWARTITATTKPKLSIPPINNTNTVRWCRITPCAPSFSVAAHDTDLPRHNALGFNRLCLRKCASVPGSGSGSGSGILGNMGSEDNKEQQQQESKLLTLPTILTLGRVAAVPLLICTFYVESWWGTTATTSIFIAASITDWLDGYLARKMKLGSSFGAFLDPVADKLMVAATLVLLCSKPLEVGALGQIPWLLTVPSIAIIGREITMSAVREWAASQNSKLLEAVAVNNLGKWKTATQMTALTILLATRDTSLGGSEIAMGSGVVLLYVSAGLAVMSLVAYMKKIWKVLLK